MTLIDETKLTEPFQAEFAEAIFTGFSQAAKYIPTKYHYDERGSALFEEITQLDEYYPTRTEIGLLKTYGDEIAQRASDGCAVVEFGSGSSRKTHILLEHMRTASAYVPIDIDEWSLKQAVQRLKKQFPELALHPVHADFSKDIKLPDEIGDAPRLGFFPGSTIGNFELVAAVEFMKRAGQLLGHGSALLIGADLQKDLDILVPAYDDAKGVTAAFTMNLLHRINRELEGNFEVSQFAHRPLYNEKIGRIESYIESLIDQDVKILDRRFSFNEGERIHVENSHKYTIPQFQQLAMEAGWVSDHVWVDDEDLFSLHYLTRK
jgi:dimethylhistidine N-methyltransferase